MTIVQFSDTHVSAPGTLHFGHDSGAYLAGAVAAVNALDPQPAYVVVTGDLVDTGRPAEYAAFRAVMSALRAPYFVIPGNHDDRDAMRRALPAASYANATGPRVRFAIDDFPVRLLGLDANGPRPWPGAALGRDDLAWLARTLASAPERPTVVAVHQPPFASGLPYVDAFGFRGARALRATLARAPGAGLVIAGHVHHVVSVQWEHARAITAPSSVPQRIPLLLAKGRIAGVLAEAAGFAVHAWDGIRFRTEIRRRTAAGGYSIAS